MNIEKLTPEQWAEAKKFLEDNPTYPDFIHDPLSKELLRGIKEIYLSEKEKDYSWTFENGVVVLHRQNRHTDYYTRENLERAIENIKSNRKGYATEEAWLRNLRMHEEGLCYFSLDNFLEKGKMSL